MSEWTRTGKYTRTRPSTGTQMAARKDASQREDSIYQPSSGREVVEGMKQVLTPGARRKALDKKIDEAS